MSLKTYINDEIQAFRKKATGDLNFGIQYGPTDAILGIHDAYPNIITDEPSIIELVKIASVGTFDSVSQLYNYREIERATLPIDIITYNVSAGQYLINKEIELGLVLDEYTYFIEFRNGTDIFRTEAFCASKAFGPPEEVFTIEIDTTLGTGDNFQLPLPSGQNYGFRINWGDSNEDTIIAFDQAETLHTYLSGGTYIITIIGKCGGWAFNNLGDKLKVVTVHSWGDIKLDNITSMFYGCLNLTSIPDAPMTGISNVTTLIGVFRNTGITAIPNELFKFAVNTNDAFTTFRDCSLLITIGADVFKYCVNITNFAQCFQSCIALQAIPVDIYRYNVKSNSFSLTHFNNISLSALPNNLFFYNVLATSYGGTFDRCRNMVLPSVLFDLTAINIVATFGVFMSVLSTTYSHTGTIQDIWNYALSASSLNAFLDDTLLSNYPAIPNGWKGL